MEKVRDYHYYTELMRNGFYDKLFFIDKLFEPWDTLLDYGCAEGFISKLLGKIFRDKRITGYDENEKMITRAKYSGEILENVSFTENPEDILIGQHIAYLSSTVHEVYSYKSRKEVEKFWESIFCPGRRYVIIRDMFYDGSAPDPTATQVRAVVEHAQQHQISHILKEFEKIFSGTIDQGRIMTHWLLKYPYMTGPNYERELYENYLPLSYYNLGSLIHQGWETTYQSHETLPWMTHQWKKDFGMEFNYPTHGKFIIKKQ